LGYYHEKLKTSFAWGLNYFNYGNTPETDAAGNIMGDFRPVDWVMQLSASKKYMDKWNYGATIKYMSSNYGQYRANGVAIDVGVLYDDTSKNFTASVLVKNLGSELKKYNGTEADDLPFDLQIGFTKRLENAPFNFSITAQRVHRPDLRYTDTTFNIDNGFPGNYSKKITVGKLIDHLVLATTIYLGDRVEINAGYNFLRRRELNIGNSANGLNGFSMGAAVSLGKLQVKYARAYYQSNTAFNQFGLNMKLNEYFGLGRFGERIKW